VGVAATLLAVCLAAWLLRVARPLFITLISAILLAFILEPLVQLLMRLRIRRGLASFLACSLMLGALYLALLGPGRKPSVSGPRCPTIASASPNSSIRPR